MSFKRVLAVKQHSQFQVFSFGRSFSPTECVFFNVYFGEYGITVLGQSPTVPELIAVNY